ncbi:DEAD-box ATP-dependent RNA helicase 1 [Vigna radiata var. radiata]|uniref:ATP-dependent RNA helicase n=1 Tax=Vigna radiata var. radiata TaxID=3916 RepID=A0A1S3TD48_VIGRR|nr:DEAD-box ATP-dependent RNA helicase 1 [Vigna radiata var. radiata]
MVGVILFCIGEDDLLLWLAKVVLSATLTRDPGRLVQLNLRHPLFLSAGKMRYRLPENLESFKLICERKVKPLYLVALLKSLGEEKCIVFTRFVDSTHRLCKLLNCFGDLQIDIKEYSGRQHQRVRSKTLNEFRKRQFQVLVSSDAMTRGMDVEGVRNVINYDVPKYIKTYVHRAGRIARAGQTGRWFTLMSNDEEMAPAASSNMVPASPPPSFKRNDPRKPNKKTLDQEQDVNDNPSSVSMDCKVRLQAPLDHQVQFDDHVVIQGSAKELGSWNKNVPLN